MARREAPSRRAEAGSEWCRGLVVGDGVLACVTVEAAARVRLKTPAAPTLGRLKQRDKAR